MSSRLFPILALALLLPVGCSHNHEAEESDEAKVNLADVPPAVKATLQAQAPGATLPATIDKESDHGKTVYEADLMINGKNHEIKVSPDGTLVSNKLDEGDEKDEKNEKHEKHEKEGKD